MKYFLVAATTCSGDITTCCSDYGIAMYLNLIQKALDIICFVVPIILIVMVTVNLVQLVLGPDDPQKKKTKSLINKIIAAVVVFFIPTIVNTVFLLMPNKFELSRCWKAAEKIVDTMNATEEYDANTGEKYAGKYTAGGDALPASSYKKKVVKKTTGKTTTASNGNEIVRYAKKYVGNPYVWGGNSLTHGTDCSGFAKLVYAHFGITLPRTTYEQVKKGKSISSLDKAQPGDLLFYYPGKKGPEHVAIYAGGGKKVHAKGRKYGIVYDKADKPMAIRRLLN